MQQKEHKVVLEASEVYTNEHSYVYIVFLILLSVSLILCEPNLWLDWWADQRGREFQAPLFPINLAIRSKVILNWWWWVRCTPTQKCARHLGTFPGVMPAAKRGRSKWFTRSCVKKGRSLVTSSTTTWIPSLQCQGSWIPWWWGFYHNCTLQTEQSGKVPT